MTESLTPQILPAPSHWDDTVDLVVAGSGVGGLTAAVRAGQVGLEVAVLEKTEAFGGLAALMGGALWMPNNRWMRDAGIHDSREDALAYLEHAGIGRGDRRAAETYVEKGPAALAWLEDSTSLSLLCQVGRPDYADGPGARSGGRCLVPDPAVMPDRLAAAEDQELLARVRRTPDALQVWADPQEWPQGRALVGGLVLAAADHGAQLHTETPVTGVFVDRGRVVGVRIATPDGARTMRGRRGVLLATGGFQWNAELTRRHLTGPTPRPISLPSNTGDGHLLAQRLGAATALLDYTLWTPAMSIPGDEIDGQPVVRPIAALTTQPGCIVVNRWGRRAYNESHWPSAGRAFEVADAGLGDYVNLPAWVIFDQRFRERHAVGPLPPGRDTAEWLHTGDDLAALARAAGINAAGLAAEVERFNGFAASGRDVDFGRGEGTYDAWWGDRDVTPNPCLAPLVEPPFHAVEIQPGTVTHLGGVVIDEHARVMAATGEPIEGLYASGVVAACLPIGRGYTSGFGHAASVVNSVLAVDHLAGA